MQSALYVRMPLPAGYIAPQPAVIGIYVFREAHLSEAASFHHLEIPGQLLRWLRKRYQLDDCR